MYLIHQATIKNWDGVIDIDIIIVNEPKKKKYTYSISSEWASRKFLQLYRKGRKFHGLALKILNQFKIKEEER